MAILIEIQTWLLQPKLWRSVCFVSSIVGLVCYALSSSFSHLFGNWSWWKMLLYIVFSFIICLAVLFAKAWELFTTLRLEAHTAFLILMITSVYSFFVDKVIKGRPDTYSLISCASFAIMSLGLSRLNHFGFEVDLLYFFGGLLTVQLMKIKLWLVVLGGIFNYSLIILRSTLDALLLDCDLELQDIDQDMESASLSLGNASSQMDSRQATIIDIDNTNPQTDAAIENEDIGFLVNQVGSDSHQGRSKVTQVGSDSHQGSSNSNSDDLQIDSLLPSNLFNRKDKSLGRERDLAQKQSISSMIELLLSGRSIKRNAMFTSATRFQSVINSCTVIEKERFQKILISRFMGRIEVLKKKNGSIISTISKHVDEYLQTNIVVDQDRIPLPQIHRDDNLVLDALRFNDDVVDFLETMRLMTMTDLEEECCKAYCSWRREFLNEALSTFGLQVKELNLEGNGKMEKIQCCVKALNVGVRILFPNERRLCDGVFQRFFSSDFAFTEVCTELATHLLSTATALAKLIPNTLEELMYEFEILFSGEYCKSLRKDARTVRKSLGIIMDSENLLTYGGGGLLEITHEVIQYIRDNTLDTIDNHVKLASEDMVSMAMHVNRITRLFERSLKANSKNYNNPTFGYVFILNNRGYIDREANQYGLRAIGYDWLQKNKRKIEKYLQLYQRSSWTKILNFLKLDINESEPNVAAELMKDKLRSFNEHFDDICNDQSTWFVIGDPLRKQIIESIENILLPAYGNFIGRLQDFLGSQAYKYIKYGIFDVKDRVNNLFLVRE